MRRKAAPQWHNEDRLVGHHSDDFRVTGQDLPLMEKLDTTRVHLPLCDGGYSLTR
jgi:hypothetical protein